MKKVLFATTALIATAGIASAEVTITGFAEFGVFDGGDDSELQFHTDIDATFTMTTETDTGLSFGASVDLDESDTDRTIAGVPVNRGGDDIGAVDADIDNDGFISPEELQSFLESDASATSDIEVGGSPAFDNNTQGGEEIFVSGNFGTLTMGDTDGAFDWALQEAIIGSAINDDHEHSGYNGNAGLDGTYDGQIARYEYAFGDFAIAVSGEIDDAGDGDPVLGIGARYSTSIAMAGRDLGLGFGVGYQRIDDLQPLSDLEDAVDGEDEPDENNPEIYGISADVDFGGGLRAIINYSDGDNSDGAVEHIGVAVGYTIDNLTVAANYGRFDMGDMDDDGIDDDADGYGLVVNYGPRRRRRGAVRLWSQRRRRRRPRRQQRHLLGRHRDLLLIATHRPEGGGAGRLAPVPFDPLPRPSPAAERMRGSP